MSNDKTADDVLNHLCAVCSDRRHALAYCCKRCKKLIDRLDLRGKSDRKARLLALSQAWDGQSFRCYYTGWELTVENPKSPYYLTWEHRTPRLESDVVVAAAIINDMKSDLTDKEFRALVTGLANRFNGASQEVPRIDPSHYRR